MIREINSKRLRTPIAAIIAFLLPFPAPHIDSYVPVTVVLLHGDICTTYMDFYGLFTAVFLCYFGGAFGGLSLPLCVLSRRR
jgi:hypothetical protein